MKPSIYLAKTVKQNFKIKVYQPLSPRSNTSSTGVNNSGGSNIKHKIPLLKLNTQSHNKGSIPDEQQAFLIKSSRESQAKQPYTATYNQSNRPDSVSNKNNSSVVGMIKNSGSSSNSYHFDIGVKSQSQIYSPKNVGVRGKSINELSSKISKKNIAFKKKTVSFQFNQEEQGAGIPVATYQVSQKQRHSQPQSNKFHQSKEEPQTSALSAMHKYYQRQLDDKDKQIQKHKNFIIQLKGSIQSLLVQHSKCKNDLQRTKTQLTELKKIHEDSFKRPGQSLRQSKDKQDFDYFQIFDKKKNQGGKNNISGEAKSLDIHISHKSFTNNNKNDHNEYDNNYYNEDMKELHSSRSRSSEINKLAKYSNKLTGLNQSLNKNRPNSAFSVNHIHRYSNKLTELNKQQKQKHSQDQKKLTQQSQLQQKQKLFMK